MGMVSSWHREVQRPHLARAGQRRSWLGKGEGGRWGEASWSRSWDSNEEVEPPVSRRSTWMEGM